MKKILLLLTVLSSGFMANSQVVFSGVSPVSIQGNYDFAWADPAGGDWSCPDFLVPGTFVEDTLMIVDDGTPGLNLQGNPLSAEACNGPLINDLTGKIAVIYRNTCEFGYKALQAQDAGAVAAIIINREDEIVQMGGGVEGLNVTIPCVFVTSLTGNQLVTEMSNGPVVVFLGSKVGAYVNDIGANSGQALVSPYGGANSLQYDGFEPGIQVYNYGTDDQAAVSINAKIDGPSGTIYDETVGPVAIVSGDTLAVFPGNTDAFPAWNEGIGNYENGEYTLTYTMDLGGTDDSDFDNVLSSSFSITDGTTIGTLAVSPVDASGMPVANTYPSNATTEYQGCVMIQEPNSSTMAVQGMYFIPHTDTSVNDLAGSEIFGNAYQWDDGWVDLDDPNYDFAAATTNAFNALNIVTFGTHYPASNDDVDDVAYIEFVTPFLMVDNQRYLFCLQTFETATISFGYDNTINYDGNEGIYRQPVAPVHIDGQWYSGGWSGASAPALSLKTFDPAEVGITDADILVGGAFPNPTTDAVTITVNATGTATLTVTDISGKIVMNSLVDLGTGSTRVNTSQLEAGVYVFTVIMENGKTAQFNLVKQ
ncbi:MAG: T9SS type A sorting domain-containing protein [Crocinitomicaceae bacterium]|nr:T9SS type A sorting domain-containing protein [Crocinitomicaceae bacterium]